MLALLAARRLARERAAAALLCVFALGCVFLAGEELSWGQHVFGWATPEAFASNVQGETNLHNLSGVNKSVPKWIVVLGIAAGGVGVPLARRLGALPAALRARWAEPLLTGAEGAVLAAVTLLAHLCAKVVAKAMGFRFEDRFGVDVPENVELLIAAYLALYALGVWRRARSGGGEGRTGGAGG